MHARSHLNTREAPRLSGKPRNFFVGQTAFNRNRTQARQLVLKAVESADISLRNRDNLLELFNCLVKVRRLGRRDFQGVHRIIRG